MEEEHSHVDVINKDDYVALVCRDCGKQGVASRLEREDAHVLAEERLYALECVPR